MSKNKQWYFTVEFDEDKIRQHGTTVEDVRAAINEIAKRNNMEEAEPGTWIIKPGAKEWLAEGVTLALMSKNKNIMRTVKKIRYWEGTDKEWDYLADLRDVSPQSLVF